VLGRNQNPTSSLRDTRWRRTQNIAREKNATGGGEIKPDKGARRAPGADLQWQYRNGEENDTEDATEPDKPEAHWHRDQDLHEEKGFEREITRSDKVTGGKSNSLSNPTGWRKSRQQRKNETGAKSYRWRRLWRRKIFSRQDVNEQRAIKTQARLRSGESNERDK
jgi:hypothetical protein